MKAERFPNTIGPDVRERVTGIEHLEQLLGDPVRDDYRMCGCVIDCMHYDHAVHTLDVDILVRGSSYECPADKDIFIHFRFEGVVGVQAGFDSRIRTDEMLLRVDYGRLACSFDGAYLGVVCDTLTITPITFRPKREA